MSFLGKATGYFSLQNSTKDIGSFFSIEDTLEILGIDRKNVSNIELYLNRLKVLNKEGFVDETKLYRLFRILKMMFSDVPAMANVSFDEYILVSIIHRKMPEVIIEQQPSVENMKSRFYPDMLLSYKGSKVFLEFDGPGHFISNKKALENPFDRSKKIEDITGIEVVHWPYWIQRCSQNVRTIFDRQERGYGALWSSNAQFGDFTIANAGKIIIQMTERFNAVDENGVGYFYEANQYGRVQPEHPILKKILKGKENVNRLIPHDAVDKEFWVPKSLWSLL